MRFTLSLRGNVAVDVEAEDLGIELGGGNEMFGVSSYRASIDINGVTGTVRVEGTASVEGVEFDAADFGDFDPDVALSEALGDIYGNIDVSDATFEVEDFPTGYNEVLGVVGDSETAVAVFAALAAAGLEVA